MSPSRPLDAAQAKRRTLSILVNTTIALVGGAFSALLGVFAIRPAKAAGRERWIRAATLSELTAHVPIPRVLAVPRPDGWYKARSRETVFLIWDGARQVKVFSATCSHLGCQVLWDNKDKKFRCPCHGGVYDANGQVIDGPPPRPLAIIDARVESTDDSVLVKV